MWRDAWLICRKDLRVEARSRVTAHHVLPFVLTVVMLLAFALDGESTMLRRATGGLFWVTVLFAANMMTQRAASVDRQDGIPDAMRLTGISPAASFFGKTLALFVELTLTESLVAVAMVLMYDVRLTGAALLLVTIPIGTLAISAVGAIYGPLAASASGRESVLPLLMLPALAPVLLAATNAFGVAFGTAVGPGWRWVGMLGMLNAIYLVAGAATAAALAEET